MDSLKSVLPAWFVAGGTVMWPILACSVVTIVVLLEKVLRLRGSAILQPALADEVQSLARKGRLSEALAVCRAQPGPFSAIARAALEAAPHGREEVRQSVIDAGRHEGAVLERYLPAVRTAAAVAPLLGLLGTVTGLIRVFQVIAVQGLGQPAQLSSGIREALFTTVFGLAVAIPSLVVHEACRSRVDSLLLRMERDIIEVVTSLTRSARTEADA